MPPARAPRSPASRPATKQRRPAGAAANGAAPGEAGEGGAGRGRTVKDRWEPGAGAAPARAGSPPGAGSSGRLGRLGRGRRRVCAAPLAAGTCAPERALPAAPALCLRRACCCGCPPRAVSRSGIREAAQQPPAAGPAGKMARCGGCWGQWGPAPPLDSHTHTQ